MHVVILVRLLHDEVAGVHHLHAAVDLVHARLGGGEVHRGDFTWVGYAVYPRAFHFEPAKCDVAASAGVPPFRAEVDMDRHALLHLDDVGAVAHGVAIYHEFQALLAVRLHRHDSRFSFQILHEVGR